MPSIIFKLRPDTDDEDVLQGYIAKLKLDAGTRVLMRRNDGEQASLKWANKPEDVISYTNDGYLEA